MKYCTCTHTAKHHKQSGRCRKGCDCQAAWVKWQRKLRAR
jgi:hypothetical protein